MNYITILLDSELLITELKPKNATTSKTYYEHHNKCWNSSNYNYTAVDSWSLMFEVNQWKFVLELKWFHENIAAKNTVAMQKKNPCSSKLKVVA